jgi:hypothetical protein
VVATPGASSFAVLGGGVRMPVVQVAEAVPVPVVKVVPVEEAVATTYVPPVFVRKQDRN